MRDRFTPLVKLFSISAAAITVIGLILFAYNRIYFNSKTPIDNELFGQFGDFIGGVVGTVVALIGFILLYATLNEQRIQFKKQNEDQIFYKVLDKQQNRIINSTINYRGGLQYNSYEIFDLLIYIPDLSIENEYLKIGREILCDNFSIIQDSHLNEMFISQGYNPINNSFQDWKDSFLFQLRKKQDPKDWII